MIVNKFKTTYFLKMTVEVLALILERFSSKDVSEGFQTTFAQADESDTEGGYIFTEGKVLGTCNIRYLEKCIITSRFRISKYLGYDT